MRRPSRRPWRRGLLLCSLAAALVSAGCRPGATEPSAAAPSAAVSPSPPGFSAALAAQARYTERLLAVPGIVGTGVGLTASGRAAVKVFTRAPGIQGIPASLDGVPAEILVTGEIRAIPAVRDAADPGMVVFPDDQFPRPVPIGVSTGNEGTCSAGTIAARVRSGNKVYALSNNHVYALENLAPLGSRILQPGRYDLNCASGAHDGMGSLTRFVPVVFSRTATPVTAVPGMEVQKYGKTTRLTTGRVDAINATVFVTYRTGTTRYVRQVLVAGRGPFCRAGDSGSLIVTTAGRQPVALLFAGTASGYTFANPIGDVLAAFNVAIDGT
jgi:hypothetical protein